MARINLLPWRDWERERRKNEFLANVGGVVVAAVLLTLGVGWYLDASLDEQNQRNQYLTSEIAVLDERIAEIQDLKQKREQLLARMRVIQELQGNRPIIVRVFDELVRTLAKGVFYNSLEMRDDQISLAGTAESNNRISSLMRSLDASAWFADPNLKGIKENRDAGEQASNFTLTVVQVDPRQQPADGN